MDFNSNFFLPCNCEHLNLLGLGDVPLHNKYTFYWVEVPATCSHKKVWPCSELLLLDDTDGKKFFGHFKIFAEPLTDHVSLILYLFYFQLLLPTNQVCAFLGSDDSLRQPQITDLAALFRLKYLGDKNSCLETSPW
jgi:hypothetical protein